MINFIVVDDNNIHRKKVNNIIISIMMNNKIGFEVEEFSDFEDCLQMECAKSYGAEYIVTRNVSDYSVSDIKAILPSEYLGL